jgi:acetyl-CoA acyltransferase
MSNEAVIVAAARTPIGKAPRGSLRHTRPDDLAAIAIQAVLARCPAVDPSEIEDVIFGCATPEGESGMNVARVAALRAGLPQSTPGATVNRFCASGWKPSLSPPSVSVQATLTSSLQGAWRA